MKTKPFLPAAPRTIRTARSLSHEAFSDVSYRTYLSSLRRGPTSPASTVESRAIHEYETREGLARIFLVRSSLPISCPHVAGRAYPWNGAPS